MSYSFLKLLEEYQVAEVAAVASQVIPDSQPIPLSEQPEHVQQMFESRAAGRDVTPEELYDKVPDHLKDNPQEVTAYIQGDEAIGVDAKDVSRHQSGENGGEYTNDNVSWESASDNRSAQGADMTVEREAQMEFNNTADAEAY